MFAIPSLSAGSRSAPASRMIRLDMIGSVCFYTSTTCMPFGSVNCSIFGKTYGLSGPGPGGACCAPIDPADPESASNAASIRMLLIGPSPNLRVKSFCGRERIRQ
jgi:hypothetical protein